MTTKLFTRNEVTETNDGKKKTLFILHDKVYDVSSFLNEHPGGEEVLIDHGGTDASEDFDDVGHSQDAFDLMKKYLVGELVESERGNKPPKQNWASSSYSKQQATKTESDQKFAAMIITLVGVIASFLYFAYFQ